MSNKKLLIFDIDGTLCDINQPIGQELVITLQDISKRHHIVLASGKPFGYIAGFIRQLGLDNCMVIGENGGTIMYTATFPPQSYYQIDVPKSVQELFFQIKQKFIENFGSTIWFQPNDVNLTIFPLEINQIAQIHQFAQQFENDKINTYYHKDSVDFTPKGFDKGTAVDVLMQKFEYSSDDVFVFGDGSNDLPMLVKTKNAFLVNSDIYTSALQTFANYEELNEFLKGF